MCIGSQSEEVLLIQKSIRIEYLYRLECYNVFSRVPPPPFVVGLSHYITLPEPS